VLAAGVPEALRIDVCILKWLNRHHSLYGSARALPYSGRKLSQWDGRGSARAGVYEHSLGNAAAVLPSAHYATMAGGLQYLLAAML
jgi:hypothetical protein